MTYSVTVLARARQDVWEIHDWIPARSPDGADRWLDRFDNATNNLRSNPLLFPLAPESGVLKIEIRHILSEHDEVGPIGRSSQSPATKFKSFVFEEQDNRRLAVN